MTVLKQSIRARLTLWHAAIMALILAIFALGIYGHVRESLFGQIDTQLQHSLELIEKTVRADPGEINEIERHTRVLAFQVTEDSWPLYASGGWIASELDRAAPPETGRWIHITDQGGVFHLQRIEFESGSNRYQITTAENGEQLHRGLDRLALTLFLGYPIALLLSLGAGYFLAGRLLVPLQDITQRARSIGENNLSARLNIANPHDELGQLGLVLNDAFSRLDTSFTRLKQFTQDAAHELRTPLAVMRSVGEVGLGDSRDIQTYRDTIGSMLEEVDRLSKLVEGLLTLARAESGRYPLQQTRIDLRDLGAEVVECMQILAEDKQQNLSLVAEAPCPLQGDVDMLRVALLNLVSNAIYYTPSGGTIRLRMHQDRAYCVLEVEDNGPGIAPEHQAHLFERFYRVDPSRAQHTGGSGLGLALTRWVAEAHGGQIEVFSTPGQGSVFRITLPITEKEQHLSDSEQPTAGTKAIIGQA